MRPTIVAAVSVLVLAQGAAATTKHALASITISATSAAPADTPAIVFDSTHLYRIEVSGTASAWCPPTAKAASDCSFGSPLEIGVGQDALYCYAAWHCVPPSPAGMLHLNGMDFSAFTGTTFPYSASHTYSAEVSGLSGKLTLNIADSVSDDSGSFTVTVTDLGVKGAGTKTTTTTTSAPAPSGPSGKVLGLTGKAEIQLPGQNYGPLAPGGTIPPGAKIHTGYGATVTVSIPGRGTITIGPLSLLVVESNGCVLNLGDVGVHVAPVRTTHGDLSYEVHGLIATASDRGTVFSVGAAPGSNTIAVTKDAVTVTPKNTKLHPFVLKAGFRVVVTAAKIGAVTKIKR